MNGIKSFKRIVLLTTLLALTACGGGGGGGGAPTPQLTNLDSSFGTNGKVVTGFFTDSSPSSGEAMAVQADGKIVVAGEAHNGTDFDFALARYNTDGTLDTSFNGPPFICLFGTPYNGTLATNFSGGNDTTRAVVIQPDGKIVVAGQAHNGTDFDFALARYNDNGSLDIDFGSAGTGKVTTGFFIGQSDVASAIALQTDGKIVVTGFANNGTDSDFALARYNANGSLDTSFNNQPFCLIGNPCSGQQVTDFDGNPDEANTMAIDGDGKIVVAGQAHNGTDFDFALARYNADGRLDINFGSAGTGKVTTGFFNGQTDVASAIALQIDGKIVVAGRASNGGDPNFALARYLPDGSLDSDFNNQPGLCLIGNPCSGQQVTDFDGNPDEANTMAIDGDGKIVVAGSAGNGTDDDFALARYNTDGSLDTGFGPAGTGTVTTGFLSGENDRVSAIALQTDGKIVAAGRANNNGDPNFALARYLP